MATANRTESTDDLKADGSTPGDVVELNPYQRDIYAMSKVIVESARTTQTTNIFCAALAKRVFSISNTLRTYFDTRGGVSINGANFVNDSSIIECLSELEAAMRSACALVEHFCKPEKWTGKALRALKAQSYQREFVNCEAWLAELETRLARIILLKFLLEKEQIDQASHEEI
ncbi:hypothetical protein FVE85_8846 [Porphyridium purpureum]|uniref:Uncharacterized protein n=1 Tax=Porphyridium purpureum TaxID=35688 RepID=A0A5J4YPE9_PORPP|nr:hypothetical protein FVE85_8846 [Porphyridium purpureum]|eukprot:POR9802..scf296_7